MQFKARLVYAVDAASGLYGFFISEIGFFDDFLYMGSYEFSFCLGKVFDIDWLAIFQNYMGFPDFREMVFKNTG